MKEEIRRAVVSEALTKISGRAPSSIYSYERSQYSSMSKGYDYEAGAYFSDSYHYGTGTHFTLKVKGDKFEGYDYGSGDHFSGTIKGKSISFYDYGEGKYFNYSA